MLKGRRHRVLQVWMPFLAYIQRASAHARTDLQFRTIALVESAACRSLSLARLAEGQPEAEPAAQLAAQWQPRPLPLPVRTVHRRPQPPELPQQRVPAANIAAYPQTCSHNGPGRQ